MSTGIPTPVAVVDVGSGSVKLLIAEGGDRGQLLPLAAIAVKTRLSADLPTDLGDPPSEAALAATDEALAGFANRIAQIEAERGPVRRTVVTTAVGRSVSDLSPLEAVVVARLGTPLEVLTGAREAELAFAGAMLGRPALGRVAVVDIGSGSTEFAVGVTGARPETWSLPLGARTVTDRFLASDPPRPEELSSALSVVEQHLEDLRRELSGLSVVVDEGSVIGVGAMVDIAAVEIGLPDPAGGVDGYTLTRTAAEEVFRALATESAQDRIHNPGLNPDHVDDIVGALCILVEFLRQFGVDKVLISERGLRHGLAAELLAAGG